VAIIAGELSVRERAVLFTLFAEARSISNPELEERVGFRLQGVRRRRLNNLGLVVSRKCGRAFAHELSEAGWRWCAAELAAGATGTGHGGHGRHAASNGGPRHGTGIERALYAVIGSIGRCLDDSGLSLADLIVQLSPTDTGRPPAQREPEYQGTHRGKPREVRWDPVSANALAEMSRRR
jgi:hypothetical protein